MLPLTIKKWRNVTLLGFLCCGLLLFAEIFPLMGTVSDAVVTYFSSLGARPDVNEIKREIAFNQDRKKQVTALRKNILSPNKTDAAGAMLISSMDSLAKKMNCRLLAVLPLPQKPGDKHQFVDLQVKAEYNDLYNFIRSMKKLPVLFSISGMQYTRDEEKDKGFIGHFRIELLSEGSALL